MNPCCKTTHLKWTINLKVLGILLKIFGPNWRCSPPHQQAALLWEHTSYWELWLSCGDFLSFPCIAARASPDPWPGEAWVVSGQEALTRGHTSKLAKPTILQVARACHHQNLLYWFNINGLRISGYNQNKIMYISHATFVMNALTINICDANCKWKLYTFESINHTLHIIYNRCPSAASVTVKKRTASDSDIFINKNIFHQ